MKDSRKNSDTIRRRSTIDDVAQAAGVSAPVVSIVLNNRFDSTIGASAATRERIKRVAQELNYKPSIAGRGLVARKSYLIGLLLSQGNASLVADVIRGVQDVAAERRYSPVVYIHNDPRQEAEEFERSQDRQVDALIVDTFDAPADAANIQSYVELAGEGFPIVELFGHSIPNVPRVNVDFEGDGRRAAEHLVQLGHREIALVMHDGYQQSQKHWASSRFAAGYQSAMAEAGLECQIITAPAVIAPSDGSPYVASGRLAAEKLLALPHRPRGVVCYSTRRALGLLEGLKQHGVGVPDDISVVGFYEQEIAALVDPPLTSLVAAGQRAGQAAAEVAFSLLTAKTAEKKETLIPSEWVLFNSTRSGARFSANGAVSHS